MNQVEAEKTGVQSWVEHWLDRYCEPAEHDFELRTPQTLACRRCEKVTIIVPRRRA